MSDIPAVESMVLDRPLRPLVSLNEALNQFDPPQGFSLGVSSLAIKEVRYGFRAVGFSFLIQEKLTSEVIPPMPFAAIPNTPYWLVGMINLHGNLVPVCDFVRVIGHGNNQVTNTTNINNTNNNMTESTKRMILILGKGDRAAGFLIDGYPCAVVNAKRTNTIPDMPTWMANCIASTFISNNEVWLEFDYENFLKRAI